MAEKRESEEFVPGEVHPSDSIQHFYQKYILDVTEDEDTDGTSVFDIDEENNITPSKVSKPHEKTLWQKSRSVFCKKSSKVAPIQLSPDTVPSLVVPEALLPKMRAADSHVKDKIQEDEDQQEAVRDKSEMSKNAVRVLVRKIILHCQDEAEYMCRENVLKFIEGRLFSIMWSEVEAELTDVDPEKIEECDSAIFKELCKIFRKKTSDLLDYLYLDREPNLYHEMVVSCAKKHLMRLQDSSCSKC